MRKPICKQLLSLLVLHFLSILLRLAAYFGLACIIAALTDSHVAVGVDSANLAARSCQPPLQAYPRRPWWSKAFASPNGSATVPSENQSITSHIPLCSVVTLCILWSVRPKKCSSSDCRVRRHTGWGGRGAGPVGIARAVQREESRRTEFQVPTATCSDVMLRSVMRGSHRAAGGYFCFIETVSYDGIISALGFMMLLMTGQR